MAQNDNYSGGWVREKAGAPDIKSGNAVRRLWNRILSRYPWLPWAGGISAGAAVLIIGLLWFFDFFESPEELYGKQCKTYILGVEGQPGELTKDERADLERLARRLALSKEKEEALILAVKKSVLADMEKKSRAKSPGKDELTPEDTKEIQALAKRMELEWPPHKKVAGSAGPIPSPATADAAKGIETLLKQGRYQEARGLAAKFPGRAEMAAVIENIDTPLSLKLSFQFQKSGESPSPIHPIDSQELSNLTLTNRDNYRFFFDTEEKETYVYIFQIDDLGKVKRIFPDPQAMERGNPLQSAVRFRMPSKESDWFYLDELTGDTQTLKETLLFVASRWPADDLDEAYSTVHRSTERKEWEKAFQHLKERLDLRKDLRKPGILYKELFLIHGR